MGISGTSAASINCPENAACALPDASGLTQTGYTFTGTWSTSSGTGATSCVSSVTNPTVNTYYACKTTNTYTITLDDATNGGTGGDGSVKEVYNDKWTNSSGTTITSVTVPTKAASGSNYYVFTGYWDAASAGNNKIPASGVLPDTKTFTSNATLKAQFETCTCTKGNHVESCSAKSVSSNKCVYNYKCDDGYHVGSSGTTATGEFTASTAGVGSNTSPSSSGNTITLTYTNGGHGTAPAAGSCTYGGTFTTAAAITGVAGWTFNKWSVNSKTFDASAANTTCNYTNLGVYSGSATIAATWTANTNTAYKVYHYTKNTTGDAYTQNGTVDNLTGTTGASLTLANLARSITGFTYSEGFADTSAKGTTKPSSGAVTTTDILADGTRVISLYYTRNTYTISYTMNSGTNYSGAPAS